MFNNFKIRMLCGEINARLRANACLIKVIHEDQVALDKHMQKLQKSIERIENLVDKLEQLKDKKEA